MTNEILKSSFEKIYGKGGDIRAYFAPGRVNLIGEHIDYNGGHVFPCALTVGNYCVARPRTDDKLRFYSENFKKGGVIVSSIEDLIFHSNAGWTNYPKGVMWAFRQKGMIMTHGFDLYIYGNIPGSGLSSSAAMEVVIGVMLKDFFDFSVSQTQIALIGQFSENKFNGMNCGIMDQFASAMGKKDHAIFLDCATLKYEYVPLKLDGYKIIVTNSNKPHSLCNSHYNDRREECEKALSDLQSVAKIKNLCELTPEEFEADKHVIKDPVSLRRAYFAVNEEKRTKDAVVALKKNDILTFGKLIKEAGESLHKDYDATCEEIDVLVDEANKQKGCIGSRETGGGWGGNTVSIVKDEDIEAFKSNVGKTYKDETGLNADFYELEIGDGGRRIF
ncbi:MAG: galactokinase [Bacilli bacterium]